MRRTRSLGGLTAILVLAVAAIGAFILMVALIDSGASPLALPRLNPDDRTPLIRVEDKEITRFHLDLARQYHTLRATKGGFVMPDHGILLQFMSQAAWEIILKKHGRPITPEAVSAERARQERESRDRDTLRKVVALLDSYPGMFEAIMVRPILANQGIHDLHQKDRTVQREAYEKAEGALKEALRDPDFFRRRNEEDPESYQRVDSRNPKMGRNPQDHFPPEQLEQERKRIEEFAKRWLSHTTPGEVRPELVDESGAYLILRLVERSGEHVVYEVVAFQKTPFDAWFEGELKKLKGEVVDPAIRLLLQEKLKDHMFGRWLFPAQ